MSNITLKSKSLKFKSPAMLDTTYFDMIDDEIMLSNGKKLQRDLVWTIFQKQELIKSIIISRYIAPLYGILDKTYEDEKLYIIDGKQRYNALKSFWNGEFKINIDDIEYSYEELPIDIKNRVMSFRFDCCFVYIRDKSEISDEILIDTFEFLNFAGTPQDIDHINNLRK